MFEIITFYEFNSMAELGDLNLVRDQLGSLTEQLEINGTIILADEGFNGTICGLPGRVEEFVEKANEILQTRLSVKNSFHSEKPFRRIEVKIKPEIVTLKQRVEMSHGVGTHVTAEEWNEIISDPDVLVLDARNDYEFFSGTFERAVNPGTGKFSELPDYVEKNLDPARHKRIAMFCTGGIRCEKFAPFLKQKGFEEVYQLEGGILNYLTVIDPDESLWQGECFVFDTRVTVDSRLEKGELPDRSFGKRS
ncbi:MAG: hypothetical protein LC730_04895 [Acidobacteria bacterium]|nr:hypothetical protein [Acidobacteriota bacterium]